MLESSNFTTTCVEIENKKDTMSNKNKISPIDNTVSANKKIKSDWAEMLQQAKNIYIFPKLADLPCATLIRDWFLKGFHVQRQDWDCFNGCRQDRAKVNDIIQFMMITISAEQKYLLTTPEPETNSVDWQKWNANILLTSVAVEEGMLKVLFNAENKVFNKNCVKSVATIGTRLSKCSELKQEFKKKK